MRFENYFFSRKFHIQHLSSSCNTDEVDAVLKFIDIIQRNSSEQIKLSDIGVVSPYRLQCKKIKNACIENGFDDITVGTSETFQGQERKCIIVSTVQSNQRYVGQFVSDPQVKRIFTFTFVLMSNNFFGYASFQRMNVMLTRAINLLIVVGDPFTLRKDERWATFIDFCYNNGGFIQSSRTFRPK